MTISRGSAPLLLLLMVAVMRLRQAEALKAPRDVKVQQIWPGQVQVVWAYDNLRNVIFTVQHKAVGDGGRGGGWESRTVFEQSVVVLEGFRAHTNYTIKVAALKGDQVQTSAESYIFVREGVPWSPTELVFYKEPASSSYLLSWKAVNPGNVDGFLILVAYGNETVAIETSHTKHRFDGVLPETAQYKIQVFAFNTVGKSEPAVVMVNPTLAKRQTVGTLVKEPEYDPEYPQETLLYILIPIGVVLVAAFVLLIIILIVRRKRETRDDSVIYDEIPSQEPFLHPKNLSAHAPAHAHAHAHGHTDTGTQTRSCAVQATGPGGGGDVPSDRVLNYAVLGTQQHNPSQNDLNVPYRAPSAYYSSGQFHPDCGFHQPKSRLKKSDSISSYTRYDDVDTDCEDYVHNSSSDVDVLQTSHLDIPKTSVRFSPCLNDRKSLSRKIPIFPIENERIYCVVDIDRYKLHPSDLPEQDRLSPVY